MVTFNLLIFSSCSYYGWESRLLVKQSQKDDNEDEMKLTTEEKVFALARNFLA